MEGSGLTAAIGAVSEVSTGVLGVAGDVVEFITSHGLLMIGVGIGFAFVAVRIIKRFI